MWPVAGSQAFADRDLPHWMREAVSQAARSMTATLLVDRSEPGAAVRGIQATMEFHGRDNPAIPLPQNYRK